MTKFYIGCTHFGHANIIKHCRRPWWTTNDEGHRIPDAEAMDEALVENWNAKVPTQAEVHHLGDLFWWKLDAKAMWEIWTRLHGDVDLTLGNHDRDKRTKEILPQLKEVVHESQMQDFATVIDSGLKVGLYHYGPHHFGAMKQEKFTKKVPRPDTIDLDILLHSHSHCHGGTIFRTFDRGDGIEIPAVDMGVEGWGYEPATLAEITQRFAQWRAGEKGAF